MVYEKPDPSSPEVEDSPEEVDVCLCSDDEIDDDVIDGSDAGYSPNFQCPESDQEEEELVEDGGSRLYGFSNYHFHGKEETSDREDNNNRYNVLYVQQAGGSKDTKDSSDSNTDHLKSGEQSTSKNSSSSSGTQRCELSFGISKILTDDTKTTSSNKLPDLAPMFGLPGLPPQHLAAELSQLGYFHSILAKDPNGTGSMVIKVPAHRPGVTYPGGLASSSNQNNPILFPWMQERKDRLTSEFFISSLYLSSGNKSR